MPTPFSLTGYILIVGAGATLFMDGFALILKKLLGIPPLNYAMVGRWAGHAVRGRLIHSPVTSSPPVAGEAVLGWSIHYLTGVVFAGLFQWIVGPQWVTTPRPLPAILFGAASIIAPFLILQPGMGAGLAARKTPKPNVARLRSLLAHLSFGVGLYATGLVPAMAA